MRRTPALLLSAALLAGCAIHSSYSLLASTVEPRAFQNNALTWSTDRTTFWNVVFDPAQTRIVRRAANGAPVAASALFGGGTTIEAVAFIPGSANEIQALTSSGLLYRMNANLQILATRDLKTEAALPSASTFCDLDITQAGAIFVSVAVGAGDARLVRFDGGAVISTDEDDLGASLSKCGPVSWDPWEAELVLLHEGNIIRYDEDLQGEGHATLPAPAADWKDIAAWGGHAMMARTPNAGPAELRLVDYTTANLPAVLLPAPIPMIRASSVYISPEAGEDGDIPYIRGLGLGTDSVNKYRAKHFELRQ